MGDSLQAMHYISLVCDAASHNTDDENEQWQKANQNRLNQNFSVLSQGLQSLFERLENLERQQNENT